MGALELYYPLARGGACCSGAPKGWWPLVMGEAATCPLPENSASQLAVGARPVRSEASYNRAICIQYIP